MVTANGPRNKHRPDEQYWLGTDFAITPKVFNIVCCCFLIKCVKTRSDEEMTMFFTSGTTGKAKMAEHTHAS